MGITLHIFILSDWIFFRRVLRLIRHLCGDGLISVGPVEHELEHRALDVLSTMS